MSNAVTKAEAQTHMTVADTQANQQEVLSGDVLIPRLLLMQGISPLVTQRKAQLGELVRSTTGEKLGNPEKGVNIVPIKMVNTWTNYELVSGKQEYRSNEPRTAANEGLEWEYQKQGTTWNRKKTISLFALVPEDVAAYEKELARAQKAGEAPDLTKTILPVVITFQSTSFKWAGKKCASFFNTVRVNSRRMPNITPYDYVIPLICKEEKGTKGTYFVYDMGNPVPLKDKEVRTTAALWFENLSNMDIKTDDSGEVAEHDTPSSDLTNEV